MKPAQAVIYGDSLMNGTVVDEAGHKESIMGRQLQRFAAAFGIEAKNRSRFGITIEQGQRLLDRDIEHGLSAEYAVVEFGGNDCNFNWHEVSQRPDGDHQPRTRLDRFESVCRKMVDDLKRLGIRPILMTLPPLDAERYLCFLGRLGNDYKAILRWLGDVQMIYRFHESYSNAIARIAAETKSLLVDVRGYFLDKHCFRDLMCPDGIHPNAKGHELVYRAFCDFAEAQMAFG